MASVNFTAPKPKGDEKEQLAIIQRTLAEWAQTLNYAFSNLEISYFTLTDQQTIKKGDSK